MKTLTALSGVLGTLVGVSATVAIAWITQAGLRLLAATVEPQLARKSARHHPESLMKYPG